MGYNRIVIPHFYSSVQQQKITVPDDNEFVIKSLDASGVFKRVQDKKVTKKEKK